jgi:hypothetical protein
MRHTTSKAVGRVIVTLAQMVHKINKELVYDF